MLPPKPRDRVALEIPSLFNWPAAGDPSYLNKLKDFDGLSIAEITVPHGEHV
jgi:hypothetical protein